MVQQLGLCNRAPGPDGMPSWVWGVLHDTRPLMLNANFNAKERNLPRSLDRVHLALLKKLVTTEATCEVPNGSVFGSLL